MKMKITVEFESADGDMAVEAVRTETIIPDFQEFKGAESFRETFDVYEKAVLKARNQSVETATENYLSELSKKKPFYTKKNVL